MFTLELQGHKFTYVISLCISAVAVILWNAFAALEKRVVRKKEGVLGELK